MHTNKLRKITQSPRLDGIDGRILEALQNNARLSNKELAHAVGLAASSCLERVRRLVQSGVLRGFHAEVAPEAMGIELQAMIAVRLVKHSRGDFEAFRTHLLTLPEVMEVYHVSGGNDFLVHVGVRDVHHVRDLALDAFTSRPEVEHLETMIIFERVGNPVIPNYRAGCEDPGEDAGR